MSMARRRRVTFLSRDKDGKKIGVSFMTDLRRKVIDEQKIIIQYLEGRVGMLEVLVAHYKEAIEEGEEG
jgi:hypothetical protein